jgi:pentatricopeptide repeat protein
LEVAAELLEQMKQENVTPDRATYIYMIIMYSRKGWHQQTVQMFENMRLSSCIPDKATYNTVLTAYSKLGTPFPHVLLYCSQILAHKVFLKKFFGYYW